MKKTLLAAGVMAVIGGAAFAGGYTAPVTEAPVTPAPVAPVAADNVNWTGFYGGVQLGYGKPNGAVHTDGVIGGVHGGYLWDRGNYVLGGEVAYNAADMDAGNGNKVKDYTDLKFIAGVPVGPSNKWLPYGTLGASYARADIAGNSHSDTVPLVGIGVKYQLNQHWTVGTEVDYRYGHDFDSTNSNLNSTEIAATASFRF